jgi:hypothetical protein
MFAPPRSDASIAVIVPQLWLPDDRDGSARKGSATVTLDPMHVHKAQRPPLDDRPNLKRGIEDVEELPCWKKT